MLTNTTLTLPREKTYFTILALCSGLVWLLCLISIVPVLILAWMAFVIWLAQGILVARIRSEAVRVDQDQMPELSAVFSEVCKKLNLAKVPKLYILQAGGMLNAFATRHCSRDFVVLFSDILEAYGPDSAEIRFLLGHEIGHIRSKHLLKNMFLLPGLFLPILGSAYSRACESSCDRYGAFASEDLGGSMQALMILSGGKTAGKSMVAEAFSKQHLSERGFFVSLHELFSSYPTLSKRVRDLLDLHRQQVTPRPGRNPLALLLAAFCPGARFGVFGMVAVVYLLATGLGVALPAFSKAREKAQQQSASQERLSHP